MVFLLILVSDGKEKRTKKKQKNNSCFYSSISEETFYAIAISAGKGIRRVTSLHVKGSIVYGTVRSQSGISDWDFEINFNDNGKITGKYCVTSNNSDSDIPEIVACRIARKISDHLKYTNAYYKRIAYREKAGEANYKVVKAYCPYCGRHKNKADANFCAYCGMYLWEK